MPRNHWIALFKSGSLCCRPTQVPFALRTAVNNGWVPCNVSTDEGVWGSPIDPRIVFQRNPRYIPCRPTLPRKASADLRFSYQLRLLCYDLACSNNYGPYHSGKLIPWILPALSGRNSPLNGKGKRQRLVLYSKPLCTMTSSYQGTVCECTT
jgi:dTDP-D-glucose 4,6-dehydratase